MAAEVPQFKLNNGVLMPSVGMGKFHSLSLEDPELCSRS